MCRGPLDANGPWVLSLSQCHLTHRLAQPRGGSESPRAHPPWMQMFWFNVVLLFTAPAVTQCYLWAAEVGELPWRLWYPAMLFSLGLGVLNGKRLEITELGVFFVCTLRRPMIFSVMAKEPKVFSAFLAGLAFTVFIYSHFIHSVRGHNGWGFMWSKIGRYSSVVKSSCFISMECRFSFQHLRISSQLSTTPVSR